MDTAKSFKLARHTGWYNPFELLQGVCNYGYVNEIRIFKGGETIAVSQWLSDGNNPYYEIELPFEVEKKRKEDLETVRAYMMTKKKECKSDQSGIILYIHADLLDSFKITKKESEVCFDKMYVRDNDMTVEFMANAILSDDKYNGDEKFKPHRVCFTGFNGMTITEYGIVVETLRLAILEKTSRDVSVFELRDILSVLVKELKDPETRNIIEKNLQ